jgi:hypothetical protein
MGVAMNANQLSEISHLATRLQSAGMIHVANMRECQTSDDDLEVVSREAESILKLAERLAFAVGQLQRSVATEVRRPKLDEFVMLESRGSRPMGDRFILNITEHEGADHD